MLNSRLWSRSVLLHCGEKSDIDPHSFREGTAHSSFDGTVPLLAPLRKAKVDVHLTLGNHDNRKVFYEIMQEERPQTPLVESRHISVVKTKFANFFLLDSLKKTMVTQGRSGSKQRSWPSGENATDRT